MGISSEIAVRVSAGGASRCMEIHVAQVFTRGIEIEETFRSAVTLVDRSSPYIQRLDSVQSRTSCLVLGKVDMAATYED